MRRFGRISSHISNHSIFTLSIEFILLYLLIGSIFGIFYWLLGQKFPDYFSFTQGNICFTQAFYFSFVTQLTIGYGDLTPAAYCQLLAIAQSLLGIGLFGIWAGFAVIKLATWGDRESILLAPWAGYVLEEERFFVLFVNRNKEYLVDVNINSIVKLASYNPVPPNVNAPYIGKSAWTFTLQHVPIEDLARIEFVKGDGVKISISGTAGVTRCTNWRKYTLDQVYVLRDRDYYWNDIFTNPRFDSEFYEAFNNPVQGAIPFLQFDFSAESDRLREK